MLPGCLLERRQPCMGSGHENHRWSLEKGHARYGQDEGSEGQERLEVLRHREDRAHAWRAVARAVHHHRDGIHAARLALVARAGLRARIALGGGLALHAHHGDVYGHASHRRQSRHRTPEWRADLSCALERAARCEADDHDADVLLRAGEDRRYALGNSPRARAARRVGAFC